MSHRLLHRQHHHQLLQHGGVISHLEVRANWRFWSVCHPHLVFQIPLPVFHKLVPLKGGKLAQPTGEGVILKRQMMLVNVVGHR
uniref:Uncharacterized protein n=1 Tax=Magallana gigas TaxID=29159 RepID=K1S1W1_MAGGI